MATESARLCVRSADEWFFVGDGLCLLVKIEMLVFKVPPVPDCDIKSQLIKGTVHRRGNAEPEPLVAHKLQMCVKEAGLIRVIWVSWDGGSLCTASLAC